MKAVILPGNGNCPITDNWYIYVKDKLTKLGVQATAEDMPDPDLARRKYWIPFIKEKLNGDEDGILIGHSSGAIAIQKYLEENKCKLAVLVGTYYTDLGDDKEKKSGYFDDPWKWNKIKKNAEKIIIFASSDDPYIKISEPLFIKDQTGAEFHEYVDEGHFGSSSAPKLEFPEIITAVQKML